MVEYICAIACCTKNALYTIAFASGRFCKEAYVCPCLSSSNSLLQWPFVALDLWLSQGGLGSVGVQRLQRTSIWFILTWSPFLNNCVEAAAGTLLQCTLTVISLASLSYACQSPQDTLGYYWNLNCTAAPHTGHNCLVSLSQRSLALFISVVMWPWRKQKFATATWTLGCAENDAYTHNHDCLIYALDRGQDQ